MCKEPYFIAQCHILFNTEKVKQVKTTQERKKERKHYNGAFFTAAYGDLTSGQSKDLRQMHTYTHIY